MARRRRTDDPRVRPLPPVAGEPSLPAMQARPPAAERAGSPAMAAALATALAGAVIGFFFASSLEQGAPASTAITAEPAAIAEPGTTTTSTTTTTIPAPRTLSQLAPGFPGALYLVTAGPVGDGAVWVWPRNRTEARFVSSLPPGLAVATLAWDEARSTLAALGNGFDGPALYAGPPTQLAPIAFGADSFAWHTGTARRIAWTAEEADGSRVLYTYDLDRPEAGPDPVGPLPGSLVSWGDWGFLVARFERGPRLTALGPDGFFRAEAQGGSAGPLNTSYRDALIGAEGGPQSPIVDPTTGRSRLVGGPTLGAVSVVVSPEMRAVAWVEQVGDRRAQLRVARLVDDRIDWPPEVRIDVGPSRILDWTADGRYVLLESLLSRIDEDAVLRPLYLVDLSTGEIGEIPFPRLDVVGGVVWTG